MLSDGADKRSSEILKSMSPDERELLIALPYRVGLYISFSDETGGNTAQEEELQVLNNIIREISEDYCKSEIMQKILYEANDNKHRADDWAKNLENVPSECERIPDLLIGLVDVDTDILSVRDTLIDIAIAVAMAYRENQGTGPQKLSGGFIQKIVEMIKPAKKVDPRFLHPNISNAEREALINLSQAMGGAA